MSHPERFRESWARQFPDDDLPPEMESFLTSPSNRNLLDETLSSSMQAIERLQKELNQQNFIAQYLLQLNDEPSYNVSYVDSDTRAIAKDKPDAGLSYESSERITKTAADAAEDYPVKSAADGPIPTALLASDVSVNATSLTAINVAAKEAVSTSATKDQVAISATAVRDQTADSNTWKSAANSSNVAATVPASDSLAAGNSSLAAAVKSPISRGSSGSLTTVVVCSPQTAKRSTSSSLITGETHARTSEHKASGLIRSTTASTTYRDNDSVECKHKPVSDTARQCVSTTSWNINTSVPTSVPTGPTSVSTTVRTITSPSVKSSLTKDTGDNPTDSSERPREEDTSSKVCEAVVNDSGELSQPNNLTYSASVGLQKKSKYKRVGERPKSLVQGYNCGEFSKFYRPGLSERNSSVEVAKESVFVEKEVVATSLDIIKGKLGFKPLHNKFTSSVPSIPASLSVHDQADLKPYNEKKRNPFSNLKYFRNLGSNTDLSSSVDLESTSFRRSSNLKSGAKFKSNADLRSGAEIELGNDLRSSNSSTSSAGKISNKDLKYTADLNRISKSAASNDITTIKDLQYTADLNRIRNSTASNDLVAELKSANKSSIRFDNSSDLNRIRNSAASNNFAAESKPQIKPELEPVNKTIITNSPSTRSIGEENSESNMDSGSRLSAAVERLGLRTNKTVEGVSYKKDGSSSQQKKDLGVKGPDMRRTSGLAATVAVAVPGACMLETDIDAPLEESPRSSSHFYQPLPGQIDAKLEHPLPDAKSDSINPTNSANLAISPNSANSEEKRSKARSRQMDVYEDALPFRKSPSSSGIEGNGSEDGKIKGGSSDESDDEPIYYNMLLVRQKTFNQASTLLHSKVNPSERFEQQVRKLSMRFQPGHGKRQSAVDVKMRMAADGARRESRLPPDESPDGSERGVRIKRRSMALALDSDSQSDFDELDVMMPPVGAVTDENSQIRKWIVQNIVESEITYVEDLGMLLQWMGLLKNLEKTPQEIISHEEIDIIFHKVPDLHRIHSIFRDKLKPKVEHWTEDQCIADIFYEFATAEYQVASSYLRNYPTALATIQRCNQEGSKLQQLTTHDQKRDSSRVDAQEQKSLEVLIIMPVTRFQRNSLVLKDLIAQTSTAHPDYDLLQKTFRISQNFLENLKDPSDKEMGNDSQRYLAKHDFIVESIGGERKLRHLFLFNDILVCARQKAAGSKEKFTFEAKWFIPLCDIIFDEASSHSEDKCLQDGRTEEVESLRRKVNSLQSDLKVENRRAQVSNDAQRQWSLRGHNKNIEKIKKKLLEQKVHLLLSSPQLVLSVRNKKTNKSFTLLLPSDYERTNWKSAISGLLKKPQTSGSLTAGELNNLLNNLKLPKLSTMGALLINDDFGLDEEYISGGLSVTVRHLDGLKAPADTFCTIELDSYGHFFMQAQTTVIRNSINPKWDQEFDIDLEGAQTLRILCYKVEGSAHHLVGKCAFELSRDWLKGNVIHETISVGDEMSISFSLSLRTRDQTLRRTLSTAKEGLFGAKIRSVTRREGSRMPLIVTACIEEIESRGMKDVGIYRVSGLSGEIQKLKRMFEKNSRAASNLLKTLDVNVITCLLKLYLRELPEALFTDALYPNFVSCMSLADPETKEKYMLQLVRSLSEPNYSTAMYILDHLIRVSKHVEHNRMTIQNLATVFGPTLFRPAVKEAAAQKKEDMFMAGTHDAMTQVAILLFILNLKAKGVSFGSR